MPVKHLSLFSFALLALLLWVLPTSAQEPAPLETKALEAILMDAQIVFKVYFIARLALVRIVDPQFRAK